VERPARARAADEPRAARASRAAPAGRGGRGGRDLRPQRPGQVAQRRAARRPQGRGHPRRGAPAGGLGRARDRRERRGAPARTCRPGAARHGRRLGARPRPTSPRCATGCWPSSRRLRSSARRCWTPGAPATRCAGRACVWSGGEGHRGGVDDAGRLLVGTRRGHHRAGRRRGAPQPA
jgi:hypothetical protein